jgi:hypothetical protein
LASSERLALIAAARRRHRAPIKHEVTSRSVEAHRTEPEASRATVAFRLVGSWQGLTRGTTVAETKRMTTEEVVGYLLEGEALDFLRESLDWVVQQ